MTKRVLVTGASGYIGGWCAAELVRRGETVRATLRDPARAPEVARAVDTVADVAGRRADDRLEFATADLSADDGWTDAMKDVDAVLHVASPMGITADGDPGSLIRPAVDGTLRVLRAAADAGVRRVVMTSAANAASPSSYSSEGVTDETLWTDPDALGLIPYRRAKTLAEKAAWEFTATRADAPELVTVLPGAVFGPILSTATIGSVGIIARMLGGKLPRVPRIGLEVVDVRDLVELHLAALTSPAAAGQRFLGTGEFVWMRQIAEVLRAELGADASRVSTRSVPDVLVRLAARRDPALREIAPALGRRNRHSTAKAQQVLGWKPRPPAETVLDCARSLLAHHVV
ncbi:NAD-dependent epimerase/dehydratase family protein [Frankia sp. Mgl5]|uniref:NAD-dependent epimerase/dehydratase family protein n=1 Tax=Frankia sp. Mgl5 TaxID=2933793 RepID=UPI00200D52F6|nr:NAD-dependent epimerase/dehydratase family protein [Frankia sp. Mgl5]MCK9928271.1 NAD-dependent epimerase/dehydratase family protein [Frankia sp. Mgl5]